MNNCFFLNIPGEVIGPCKMLVGEHEDIGTLGSRFDRRVNRRHTDGEILHLN